MVRRGLHRPRALASCDGRRIAAAQWSASDTPARPARGQKVPGSRPRPAVGGLRGVRPRLGCRFRPTPASATATSPLVSQLSLRPASRAPADDAALSGLLAFLRSAEALKVQHRSGRTSTARPRGSVAAHSWRLALPAIVLGDALGDHDRLRLLEHVDRARSRRGVVGGTRPRRISAPDDGRRRTRARRSRHALRPPGRARARAPPRGLRRVRGGRDPARRCSPRRSQDRDHPPAPPGRQRPGLRPRPSNLGYRPAPAPTPIRGRPGFGRSSMRRPGRWRRSLQPGPREP